MKPEFYKKKLKNGLTILFEKRKFPTISMSASVNQGFAYENEKEKGISHFAEHLMFKGTKTRTHKEIAEEIEKKGGILNAYTDEEITSYWNKLPSRHFNSSIDICKDLILNPAFHPEEFEKEKKVILEEIKMYHDNPPLHVLDKIKSLLYKKPFGISGIGTEKSVLSLSRDNLINFHKKNYSTNKMILCAVGNADMERIENFGKKFPKIYNAGSRLFPRKINKQVIEKRKDLEQAHLVFGFHAVNGRDKKRYAYELLNIILAGGMSSKLFEEIREKRGLAYAVKGSIEQGKDFSYNSIYVGTRKENVLKCKKIILKEIKRIRELDKKELEEAKEQLIGLRDVESEESMNVMNALAREEIIGKAEEFYKYDERISNINLEELKKISRIKGYSFFALIPK